MKEINMTKAISCMPDKFITMEMVELAATEHRPELVNYLPEKYITSEILDSIFKTDDYGWRSWQLSKIPEEKRNRQICLTHIAQLLPSNSLKFNHPIFQEALSGALQILT